MLEALFTATFNVLTSAFEETARSTFLSIAHDGLSKEYLFLACYTDYTVKPQSTEEVGGRMWKRGRESAPLNLG